MQKCAHANCSPVFVLLFFASRAGYKVIKKIGEGTFSEVLKTQSLKDGKFYACKTMKQTINRYASFAAGALVPPQPQRPVGCPPLSA